MCCPLDGKAGQLEAKFNGIIDNETETSLIIDAAYNRLPKTASGKIDYYFQRLEFFEKICEVADESFHLLSAFLKPLTPAMIYKTLSEGHHFCHGLEQLLHGFCFVGDLFRVVNRTFLRTTEGKPLNALGCASRICHAVSHFFASSKLLADLGFIPASLLTRFAGSADYFAAAGYAAWSLSLIKNHANRKTAPNWQDASIHLGGLAFTLLKIAQSHEGGGFVSGQQLTKAASLAGVIHAAAVVAKLMEPNSLEATLKIPLFCRQVREIKENKRPKRKAAAQNNPSLRFRTLRPLRRLSSNKTKATRR